MANLFICSCGDHFESTAAAAQKYDLFTSNVTFVTGYLSGKCFGSGVMPYSTPWIVKAIAPTPADTVIWGWRWKADPGAFPLGGFSYYLVGAIHRKGSAGAFSNATKQLSINTYADGRLYVARGNYNGTVIAETAVPVLDDSGWKYIECQAVIHSSAGSITIRIDNVVVLSVSGINTQALSTAAVDGVEWIPWYVDDAYVNDLSGSVAAHKTFFGKGFHVLVARPASDSLPQWVRSAGASNWENVDDTSPDANATNVKAQFPDTIDLYGLTSIPDGTVLTVQGNAYANKASTGVVSTLTLVVEIDGIRYESAPFTLTTTAVDYRQIWPVAPDDGTPWTVAKMQAAKWGIRRVV